VSSTTDRGIAGTVAVIFALLALMFGCFAFYTVDTLAVAPGQRFTTLVHATKDFLGRHNTPGIWAFHCHILTHAEGQNGMFGMVTTFIVEP
jgi:hypothetical protein